MRRTLTCVLAVLVVGTAFSAQAVPFTSRALWEAAVSGPITVEDFEGAALGPLSIGTTSVGAIDITLDGTIARADVNGIFSPGFVNGSVEYRGMIADQPGANDVFQITFSFDIPVFAWGADFFSTATGDLLIATANGSVYDFHTLLGGSGTGFVGSIEAVAFDSVTFTTQSFTFFGEFFSADNVSTGMPIPEPTAPLLFGAGMLVVGSALRRRSA